MSFLSEDLWRELVAEARNAPSVHNIQPTRWAQHGDEILLLGDPSRRLPAADPTGHDVRLSHGAALEGMVLALQQRGLDLDLAPAQAIPRADGLLTIASGAVRGLLGDRESYHDALELADPIQTRVSWRGAFKPVDAASRTALDRLQALSPDITLVRSAEGLARAATLGDEAGFHFLCDDHHRSELMRWMRLSRHHPDALRDGLSAPAMALGRIEAFGAGLVLGPLFGVLRATGLARPLTREAGKTMSSAAIALFHRPAGEDPLQTGRAFYRVWLQMERLGLLACPISVLADWPTSNAGLRELGQTSPERRLVNVFRLGIPAGRPSQARARLPLDELIVPTGA
jgi:nitroreductase